MKKTNLFFLTALACCVTLFVSCNSKPKQESEPETKKEMTLQEKVEEFAMVELSSPLVNNLTENEKALIPIFVEIADIMDRLFWKQTYGDKTEIEKISDAWAKEFAVINYGPWERLNNNVAFIDGYGEKPLGCQYYPTDITKEEYEAYTCPDKGSLYTVLRRNEDGSLRTVWYRDEYKEEITKVCALLDKAIPLADDPGLKKYLEERKKAFETDDYFASDMVWMDMKESKIDFVVGPIENYDDKLNEAKASYEGFILLKDEKRSADLAKFVSLLPQLQTELPGEAKYKTFVPGTSSDLNVYDAVYYAGDCNSGSKTIAINLPNDDRVQKAKGARRLQLRNSMQAKFDKILLPISDLIIEPAQRQYVKFDAFFWNVTFHEVAHGLGIKQTLDGRSVDEALDIEKTSWEEAKADILGLFLTCNLIGKGEITGITVEDAITTYIAGILRSVRFGASSSHGKANMMCYNYMEKEGAFSRNEDGTYHIDFDKAKASIDSWGALILKVQGDGDLAFATQFRAENGGIGEALQADLDKINNAGIPRDIRFKQGLETLGLK
ncbi:Zn-dependent hydrolase [Bacteroidales bacterium OttesenSCG-928-B11]|nr:Zn-dependent hydrolase [Bacteroidales bacterium OttesenSCG-928-E04]MDL2309217.1 Zn-dependent hydrolase [Bacteroidales bacterium OttesenSCG-928-C03]MDL2311565.1 Zn-dependent hydrolase [Bacteroidales bacterium OttesenSCG-928-B11]MDL2325606.1 Zn-dependent hydrolase [Bacteroidales bacterium OttesenSCG-928-A14]